MPPLRNRRRILWPSLHMMHIYPNRLYQYLNSFNLLYYPYLFLLIFHHKHLPVHYDFQILIDLSFLLIFLFLFAIFLLCMLDNLVLGYFLVGVLYVEINKFHIINDKLFDHLHILLNFLWDNYQYI